MILILQELETSLQKIDTLRQDIRKAEKLRRELELRAEDSLNEAAKEKKMREKAEKELAAFKGGEGGGGVPASSEVHHNSYQCKDICSNHLEESTVPGL